MSLTSHKDGSPKRCGGVGSAVNQAPRQRSIGMRPISSTDSRTTGIATTATAPTVWQTEVDQRVSSIVERLVASSSSSSKRLEATIAFQRLFPLSTPTATTVAALEQQLEPIRRLCRALEEQQPKHHHHHHQHSPTTVSTLEVWLPETTLLVDDSYDHDNDSHRLPLPSSLSLIDFSFLTRLLAHHGSLRRLTILDSSSSTMTAATSAILDGLYQNTGLLEHVTWQGGSVRTNDRDDDNDDDDQQQQRKRNHEMWGLFWATATRITSFTLSNITGSGQTDRVVAVSRKETDQRETHTSSSTICGNTITNVTNTPPPPSTAITTFWDGLALNRSVKVITLHQLMDPIVVSKVLRSLHENPIVTHVSLTECDMSTAADFVPRLPLLRELRLADCRVTEATLSGVATALQSVTPSRVRRLDLRGGSILLQSPSSCRILQAMLWHLRQLEHLVLEACALTDEILRKLLTPCRTPKLTNGTGSLQGAVYLSQLRSLNLRHNSLTHCHGLCHIPSLSELDVSDNALGSDHGRGAHSVAALLRHCDSRLTRLTLESCEWSEDDIRILCRALQRRNSNSSATLHHLNLSYNTSVGAVLNEVAMTLSCPRRSGLQSLILKSCDIDDDGLAILLDAMSSKKRQENGNFHREFSTVKLLQVLSLKWNKITQTGIEHLARWIRRNVPHSLHTLDLQFNLFDVVAGLDELVDSVHSNYWLSVLKVSPLYGVATAQAKPVKKKLNHTLHLNRSGRHYAAHDTEQVPRSQWPYILARADATYGTHALYHMLREATPLWVSYETNENVQAT